MKKTNMTKAIELATVLTSAEITDRILRRSAGNEVSSIYQGQQINVVASSLAYAGIAKSTLLAGGK